MDDLNFPTWKNNGNNESNNKNGNIENIDFPNSGTINRPATKEELLEQKRKLEKIKRSPDDIPDILKY